MHKKRVRNRIIWAIVGVLIIVAGWFSFAPNPLGTHKTQSKVVTIGVVGLSDKDEQIWDSIKKDAKDKYGITIKLKNFSDYTQPNKALANGDIDLNSFQHYAFLDAWNKANHGTLTPIGRTYIAPIRLYSTKYKSVKEIPDGATIAIPNDSTNESRALFGLKAAGLIKLKKNVKLATVADITSNPKNLKIKEVAADQTARVINNVAASVVNNTYAGPAHLGPKQIIFSSSLSKDDLQWINIIVARKEDKNNPVYKDVVKAFQTEKTKKLLKKLYGDNQQAAWGVKLK